MANYVKTFSEYTSSLNEGHNEIEVQYSDAVYGPGGFKVKDEKEAIKALKGMDMKGIEYSGYEIVDIGGMIYYMNDEYFESLVPEDHFNTPENGKAYMDAAKKYMKTKKPQTYKWVH